MNTARLLFAVMAVLTIASLQACSAYGGPVSGVVVDEATGKSVPDAIVVMRWHGNWTKIFGESSSACYHVETARTDVNGHYQIAPWIQSWSFSDLRFTSAGTDYNVYKPGYAMVFKEDAIPSAAHILVAPFKGTKDQCFDKVLSVINWGCAQAGASEKNLRRLYLALASEATTLAETQNHKGSAAFLLRMADEALVDKTKPARYQGGRVVNVDPRDTFRKEDVPQ